MNVEIVPAQLEHAMDLVANLRDRERQSYEVFTKDSIEHAVAQYVARSFHSYAGIIDGRIVAIWGAETASTFSDSCWLWMICGESIDYYPITFIRHSKDGIELLKSCFRRIEGVVFNDFDQSKKWLKWLGFKIIESNEQICRFEWNR
jgi:hypothetical protein